MKSILVLITISITVVLITSIIFADDRKEHEDYIRSQSSGHSYDQNHWNHKKHGHNYSINKYNVISHNISRFDNHQEKLQIIQKERTMKSIIMLIIILIAANVTFANEYNDRRDRRDHEDYIKSQSSGHGYDQNHWNNNNHRRNNHDNRYDNDDYGSPDDRQEELQEMQDERQQELIEWQRNGGRQCERCQKPPRRVFDHRPIFK